MSKSVQNLVFFSAYIMSLLHKFRQILKTLFNNSIQNLTIIHQLASVHQLNSKSSHYSPTYIYSSIQNLAIIHQPPFVNSIRNLAIIHQLASVHQFKI